MLDQRRRKTSLGGKTKRLETASNLVGPVPAGVAGARCSPIEMPAHADAACASAAVPHVCLPFEQTRHLLPKPLPKAAETRRGFVKRILNTQSKTDPGIASRDLGIGRVTAIYF